MAIPTAADITPGWIAEQLTRAGHDVEIRGMEAERIGTGQLGVCMRYELDYASAPPDAPRSVVGKFPSDSEVSRQTGVELRNYIREVRFYQELQTRLSIRTPRCYYADIVGEGPHFALLLEDLAPAVQGNQIEGCSEEVARAAVLELAGLHAPFWCSEEIRDTSWLGEPDPEQAAETQERYRTLYPGFRDRYEHGLDSDQLEILRLLGEKGQASQGGLPSPFSLIHVDYRLDNLLIDEGDDPPRVTAVDWQSITLGSPLADVAYFLGAGVLPEDRRRIEHDIVRAYHQRLFEEGVRNYAWEDCWADYRRGVFSGFMVTVIASMLVQETKRGNQMFVTMADRHSRHALDLGSEEFLG